MCDRFHSLCFEMITLVRGPLVIWFMLSFRLIMRLEDRLPPTIINLYPNKRQIYISYGDDYSCHQYLCYIYQLNLASYFHIANIQLNEKYS
jgi:hypothetical protein